MPLLRYKKYSEEPFRANRFNTAALAEVLTGDDSVFFHDLEVFLDATSEWKCLSAAFKAGDVIPDNYNTWFAEPKNEEDRKRGYFL